MIVLYIVIAILVVLFIYAFVTYNSFIRLKNQVKEAFSTMDVYLKKRWDLIPNLVETVKGYASHEKGTLEKIVELRNSSYSSMSNSEKMNSSVKLSDGISKIMAIAENYPELKADKNFRDLGNQLTQIEDDIANSRKYYNGAVKVYNNKVQMFPSNIIASLFGYKEEKMFETTSDEKKNVNVGLEENK